MKTVSYYNVKKWVLSIGVAGASVFGIATFHNAITQQVLFSQVIRSPQGVEHPDNAATVVKPGHSPFAVQIRSVVATEMTSARSFHVLPANVLLMVREGKFSDAKSYLLAAAGEAVNADDEALLAKNLSHLGELALAQSDIDTAEVYLAEALDVYELLGDEISTAGVYMQLGRLHLVARHRARQASDAYDTLLIARWKISRGQFYSAESDLYDVVERNLAINRFGAAASAYETLLKGYAREQDVYQAQVAGLEAVRLHAASGRVNRAKSLVGELRKIGVDESVFPEIESEIATLHQEFQNSVQAIGAARDYEQLYNQLQARGDVVNAWRFRQQAGESLAKASTRAQYRRQPDVLVELYRSNNSMDRAKDSLARAYDVYMRHGLDSERLRSQQLQTQIY